jgi:hypothetical protein
MLVLTVATVHVANVTARSGFLATGRHRRSANSPVAAVAD